MAPASLCGDAHCTTRETRLEHDPRRSRLEYSGGGVARHMPLGAEAVSNPRGAGNVGTNPEPHNRSRRRTGGGMFQAIPTAPGPTRPRLTSRSRRSGRPPRPVSSRWFRRSRPPSAELRLVRPAERKPPQQVAVRAQGDSPGGEAKGAHQHEIDLGEVTPNVTTAAQAASDDTPITMAMAPVPSGPSPSNGEGQGTGEGRRGGRGTLWQPDPPSTIIIRGGMGGVEDDCKRHPNGYPGMGGGIAINQRMPQRGGPGVLANNPSRRPFTPGRTGGGMRGIR